MQDVVIYSKYAGGDVLEVSKMDEVVYIHTEQIFNYEHESATIELTREEAMKLALSLFDSLKIK